MSTMPGVELKPLTRHHDQRGYFQENLRGSDDFFVGFGQWSLSFMHHDVIKAWHIHEKQYDYWLVVSGVVLAVTCDLRPMWFNRNDTMADFAWFKQKDDYPCQEFILGDNQPPATLKIPPGVAHGCKVLQGPAILCYITSEEYDGSDEGRIPYDDLGYDWDKREIK